MDSDPQISEESNNEDEDLIMKEKSTNNNNNNLQQTTTSTTTPLNPQPSTPPPSTTQKTEKKPEEEEEEEEEDYDDEDEFLKINDEYKIWKKNTPFLYDLVLTHALEWPSLTVEWLPVKQSLPNSDWTKQSLILGTHTSNAEQNYLMVAEVSLPKGNKEINIKKYEQKDVDKDDGGFGGAKFEIKQRINHDGEVNRARYMPQQHSIIATKTFSGLVYLFNYEKLPSDPSPNGKCEPLKKLSGHTKEGYGLSWSSLKKGYLASGSDDKNVCVWDINSKSDKPLLKFNDHTDIVEDVCWHKHVEHLLLSVSDDKSIRLWDVRNKKKNPIQKVIKAHSEEVNSIDCSPFSEFIWATGGNEGVIKLWDIRNLKNCVHVMESHEGEIFGLKFSPHIESVFASCGGDRRAMVWDMTKIGEHQTVEDAEDGPPELLFIHGGHSSKISDISWNPNKEEEWLLSTVAEDNIVQLWEMAENIYNENLQVEDDELE